MTGAGAWTRRGRVAGMAAVLVVLASCTGGAEAPEPDAGPPVRAVSALTDASPRVWALTAGAGGAGHAEPLPIHTGWGPTRREIAQARRLVGDLSLRERAGQVIWARYAGTATPTDLVNRLHLGGVVAFGSNITGTDQIRRSNRALQRSARKHGRRFPVTIGVDQEGGLVERVTDATRFPAFMTAGAADRPRLTRRASAASGAELAGLGFNLDFAPDTDVTAGPSDPTIGTRSASGRPGTAARHVLAAARGYWSTGVTPVLKHFPGHGSVTADSHLTLPVQRRSVAQLEDSDLVPFEAGVGAGLPSVMVGHIDVRAVDPGVPSSLSRKVVTGLLRDRLGFDGLVVTDALDMRAVTADYPSGRSAVRALKAGADVLLMPPSPQRARDGVVRAVRQGRLSSSRLVQAATRQVALLLRQQEHGMTRHRPGSGRKVSRQWSAAAVTSVRGRCDGRLVGRRVQVRGPADDVSAFKRAASAAGLKVTRHKGTKVRLIGAGGGRTRGDVVVALDAPYPLGRSHAKVRLATYGGTPGAMSALVDVLLGRAEAPGHLPVAVDGVPRDGC